MKSIKALHQLLNLIHVRDIVACSDDIAKINKVISEDRNYNRDMTIGMNYSNEETENNIKELELVIKEARKRKKK